MKYETLFSPMNIGPVRIKNRTIMAPMGVTLSADDNRINDKVINYYAERAKGGYGIVDIGCVYFDNVTSGIPEPGAFGLIDDIDFERAKRLVDVVHQHDSIICMQVLHPGRQGHEFDNPGKANAGQQPVGPSPIAENDWLEVPRELEISEVHDIVQRYIDGCKKCFDAGADLVEIHAAHGYLIHEFMSPRANKRTDEYGGSFENRMRFLTEIIQGVQAIMPEDRGIIVRINGKDYTDGGFEIPECIEIAQYIESLGVHALSISNGTYSNYDVLIEAQIYPEGYRKPLLEAFKGVVNIPIIGVNHFKRPSHAEESLKQGLCDFVALGRPAMADPYWPNKAKNGQEDQIRYCVSCGECYAQTDFCKPDICAMNPLNTYEGEFNELTIKRDGDGRKVVVVGGTLGGMEAARTLADRGFDVSLFHDDATLGGAYALGSNVPGMEKKSYAVDAFKNRMTLAGVNVELNKEITPEAVNELEPYAVFVSADGVQTLPDVPGIDSPVVYKSWDALKDLKRFAGKKVAVIGSDLTSLEVAYGLQRRGAETTVYEAGEEICAVIAHGADLKAKLNNMRLSSEIGVQYVTNKALSEVTADGIVLKDSATGETEAVACDFVVIGGAPEADTRYEDMLKDKFENLVVIGNAVGTRNVIGQTHAGFRKAWNLK